jgi:hypothetical protein
MIIFTSFSIPFELGFDCKLYGFLMGMELLWFVESFAYIIYHCFFIAKAMKATETFTYSGVIKLYF